MYPPRRLRAAPENLDDESGWLVYSDWLLSRDESQRVAEGEMIALEHALQRASPAERAQLSSRRAQVLSTYRRSRLGALSQAPNLQVEFRWGQLAEAEISAPVEGTLRALLSLSVCGHLRGLRLRGLREHSELKAVLELLRPRCPARLDLSQHHLSSDWLGALETASLPGLKALCLSNCGLTDSGLERLSRAPCFASLEHLELESNQLRDEGAAVLSRLPMSLRALRLGLNRISQPGLLALAQAPWSAGLVELDLENNAFAFETVDPLARFKGLERLGLAKNQLGDQGLGALLALDFPRLRALELGSNQISAVRGPMRFPGSLTELDLKFNTIGPSGVELLARGAPGLEALDLGYNDLLEQGGDAVVRARWTSMRSLVLRGCQLRDAGVTALSRCTSHLVTLDLGYNDLGLEGFESLLRAPSLQGLQQLNLRGNRLGATAVLALARTAGLPQLTELELGLNRLGDQGAIFLASAKHLSALQALSLSGNDIRAEGAKALAESAALQHLQTLDLAPEPLGRAGRKAMLRSTVLPEHLKARFA